MNGRQERFFLARSGLRFCLPACLCLALLAGTPARAQEATTAVFERLALSCLAEVPDTTEVFVLEAPETMAYLRTALIQRWQADGRTLFVPDSSKVPNLARLRYAVEEAGVTYERAGRRRLRRTVALGLRYRLEGADGRLLREDACREAAIDTIRRRDAEAVASEAFPETQAVVPPAGWVQRYLEPAVLTAATAVGVYLFFSLRSKRAASE